MSNKAEKVAEAIAYWCGWQLMSWSIAIGLLVLSWNYLVCDWFGMDTMPIHVAVGMILIRNAFTLKDENKKESEKEAVKDYLN